MQAFSTPPGKARRTASRLSIVMMLALLLASAVARADVILDWNAIAVDTAIQNGAMFRDMSGLLSKVGASLDDPWGVLQRSGKRVVAVLRWHRGASKKHRFAVRRGS